jgi:hypothetical protein
MLYIYFGKLCFPEIAVNGMVEPFLDYLICFSVFILVDIVKNEAITGMGVCFTF